MQPIPQNSGIANQNTRVVPPKTKLHYQKQGNGNLISDGFTLYTEVFIIGKRGHTFAEKKSYCVRLNLLRSNSRNATIETAADIKTLLSRTVKIKGK